MCYMHYKMDCCLCPVASKSTTAISTSLENLLFPKKKKEKTENVYRGLTDREGFAHELQNTYLWSFCVAIFMMTSLFWG